MDPIANLLTSIRNAYLARRATVLVPFSKTKEELIKLLTTTGFIASYEVVGEKPKLQLQLKLVYQDNLPILTKIIRVSKPSVRVYAKAGRLPLALSGRGLTIISTSKGLMTDRTARKEALGGEVICQVW